MSSVSIVLHLPSDTIQPKLELRRTLESIFRQTRPAREVLVLQDEASQTMPEEYFDRVSVLPAQGMSLSEKLNLAFGKCTGEAVCYLDNQRHAVILKRSCLDLFRLALLRHPGAAMIYGDYDLDEQGAVHPVRLLKHHEGRVRDNQDYGKVFFYRKTVLDEIGGCDPEVKANSLYDLQLKLSERAALIHISNKYSGSLYTVTAVRQKADVFDYLLAGKEVQQEAEKVFTGHLQRLIAWLAPGMGYTERPAAEAELKASVIIPVNNRPEFIATAIASVQAQSQPAVEVIVVVNGGPEDPTIAAVQEYQPGGPRYEPGKPAVHLIVTDINNIGFCLNLGVLQARGEYYVQLDSDDRLKPRAVEKILKVFASDPRIGMVIGSYEVWEKLDSGELVRKKEIPVVTHDEWTEENGRNNLLRINGAGAPRSIPIGIIREMGYFALNDDPHARNYGEDYDMVLHISERYRIGRIYDPIYEVIRHSGGTDHSIYQDTVDRNDEAKDWMRLQALRRRRQMNREA